MYTADGAPRRRQRAMIDRPPAQNTPYGRRVGWPTVLVLLAFLGASSLMLYEAIEGRARPRPHVRPELPEHIGPDTYHRYQWGPRIPMASGGEGPDPTHLDAIYDPQRSAMHDSLGILDAGADLPFAVVSRVAHLIETEGAVPVPMDAACDVRVLPVAHREFNCLVRVRCAGHIFYPNASQTAGYGHCAIADGRVRGVEDLGTTGMDGDPRIHVELDQNRVTVSDGGDHAEPFLVVLALDP